MNTRRFTTAVVCVGMVTFLSASVIAQETERVSVARAEVEGNGYSNNPSISGDGRFVAFSSLSDNLVPGDTNGEYDVFVRDRLTRTTARVSVDSSGVEGNHSSSFSSISGDGRFVAFESAADNLVPGDTNGGVDVFVHDRATGTATRVSVDSSGWEGNHSSSRPSISRDGRFVAFQSWATNLVPGDTNGSDDVFLHDCLTGATTRVSVDSSGGEGNKYSELPSISGDGRFVTYCSHATNLVPGDTNGWRDVFVHDRLAGTTTRVSVDSSGAEANEKSFYPAISGNGRFVVFYGIADNLVPDDTNGIHDVFAHDRQTGLTTRVSVDSSGVEGNTSSYHPEISEDGRFVAFYSYANNLVPGDTNHHGDVFVHERLPGTTRRVSLDSSGVEGNGHSYDVAISGDGRFVAFTSLSDNLVPDDTNGQYDIFVHGPYLTLEVDPDTVAPGDAITLTTYTGFPSSLKFLVLVGFNGAALFKPLLKGQFDGAGIWTLSGAVPPGLSGNVMTFKSVGFAPNLQIALSNPETVTFQ